MTAKKPQPEREPGTITTAVAAQLIMLERTRLMQLAKDGWIQQAGRDQWRTVDVVQGYIRFLRDTARRQNKGRAESRVRDARATEIEMRTAERARQLVPVDDAIAANEAVVGAVRVEMSGLPAAFTRDLTVRRSLEDHLNERLTRVSNVLAAQAAQLREAA